MNFQRTARANTESTQRVRCATATPTGRNYCITIATACWIRLMAHLAQHTFSHSCQTAALETKQTNRLRLSPMLPPDIGIQRFAVTVDGGFFYKYSFYFQSCPTNS